MPIVEIVWRRSGEKNNKPPKNTPKRKWKPPTNYLMAFELQSSSLDSSSTHTSGSLAYLG